MRIKIRADIPEEVLTKLEEVYARAVKNREKLTPSSATYMAAENHLWTNKKHKKNKQI